MHYCRLIIMRYVWIFFAFSILWACQPKNQSMGTYTAIRSSETFEDYWYAGLAEVNTYALEQYRYGNIHEGHSTLIFVTEPMSVNRQVKINDVAEEKSRTVLKMNATRKFNTGIYPYSVMTSAFSPIDGPPVSSPLKVTNSIQEWCGQTYLQFNRVGKNNYRYASYSYFGTEGDEEGRWSGAYLEDGLWNQIRLQADALPTGSIDLIPAAVYLRFSHVEQKPYAASASVRDSTKSLKVYEVEYQDIPRVLRICFDANFPHVIRSWEEVDTKSGGVTRAELLVSDQRAYWTQNGVDDRKERSALKLPKNHQ